jgi:hypothetical protein
MLVDFDYLWLKTTGRRREECEEKRGVAQLRLKASRAIYSHKPGLGRLGGGGMGGFA